MTYDDVSKDTMKFIAYLKANGKRPIAIAVHVVDDHENTEAVVAWGNTEQQLEMATGVIASNLGYRMAPK